MTESLPKGECFMKNGEITVRFAAENELARVNELREQVSRLHAENRPDVFRPDFCNELRQIAKNAFDADDSDVVVVCMDGDICGFAIPEYIERQKSCCRRAEKFCRISEFGVDAALRRRGAAKDDSGAEMIRKIREAFFREMNVFTKRKCKKISAVSSETAETVGFYLRIRANNTGRNRAVVNAHKKRVKTQRTEKMS